MKAGELSLVIGSVVGGIIAIMIVAGIVFLGSSTQELYQWGGVIIGFYFGTFGNLLVGLLGAKKDSQEGPGQGNTPQR